MTHCQYQSCHGVMFAEPVTEAMAAERVELVCSLCGRGPWDTAPLVRYPACGRDGCLRDAIYGKALCQYHEAAAKRRAGERRML